MHYSIRLTVAFCALQSSCEYCAGLLQQAAAVGADRACRLPGASGSAQQGGLVLCSEIASGQMAADGCHTACRSSMGNVGHDHVRSTPAPAGAMLQAATGCWVAPTTRLCAGGWHMAQGMSCTAAAGAEHSTRSMPHVTRGWAALLHVTHAAACSCCWLLVKPTCRSCSTAGLLQPGPHTMLCCKHLPAAGVRCCHVAHVLQRVHAAAVGVPKLVLCLLLLEVHTCLERSRPVEVHLKCKSINQSINQVARLNRTRW
jgi:hypothetical protein